MKKRILLSFAVAALTTLLISATLPFKLNHNGIEISKLKSDINGSASEHPLFISELNSGLIFSIDIKNNKNKFLERDFYFTMFDTVNSTWTTPINIIKNYPEFIALNNTMNFNELFISLYDDIYLLELSGENFQMQRLTISSKSNESSPRLSPDGSTLYFVSDRKGGYGGTDIWYSERLAYGKWSEPFNAGNHINTSGDEESPFLLNDGVTMYFSSNGLQGYGMFDVFSTTMNDEGLWSIPENIGSIVNSPNDDLNYILDSEGKTGYYSSDKMEKGNQDIYKVINALATI